MQMVEGGMLRESLLRASLLGLFEGGWNAEGGGWNAEGEFTSSFTTGGAGGRAWLAKPVTILWSMRGGGLTGGPVGGPD